MLKIFYSKISGNIPDSTYHQYLSGLPLLLRSKNKKYHKWQDRLLNLFGKLLLMQALHEFKLDINCIHSLYYNQYGRPYIPGLTDFNISHSGDYVICAAAQNIRVGVDIEKISDINFLDFENVMTTDQWKTIRSSYNQQKAFYNYWVIKESVIKADSKGLSIPMQDIIINVDYAQCSGKLWHLHDLKINDNYCACLATETRIESIECKFIEF